MFLCLEIWVGKINLIKYRNGPQRSICLALEGARIRRIISLKKSPYMCPPPQNKIIHLPDNISADREILLPLGLRKNNFR